MGAREISQAEPEKKMNTREIAAEYRMAHWAQIIEERKAKGENIRDFCRRTGYTEHTYYYWQQKLRKAVYEKHMQAKGTNHGTAAREGWALYEGNAVATCAKKVTIEIGRCKVIAESGTDSGHLKQICQVLLSLC